MPATVMIRPAAVPSAAVVDDCTRKMAVGVRAESADRIPERCWRMGPLTLGMSPSQVEGLLGAPVARLASGDRLDVLYVFSARPGPLVIRGRARFRQLQLRFRYDRLVLIENDPFGVSVTEPRRCQGSHDPAHRIDGSAIAGPALRFAGVGIGDPIRLARTRFGASPDPNRSHDWYRYWSIPVSFDVDPETAQITGITIARDDDTLTGERPAVHRVVHAGSVGCRLTGIDFTLVD